MDVRQYPGIQANVKELVNDLSKYFDNNDYEVQARQEAPATVVTARKSSNLRDWSGTSYALTVKIVLTGSGTEVGLGRQRWLDKIGVGVVGIVLSLLTAGLLSPFLLVPVYGIYQQYKLGEEVWNVIDKHMAIASGGSFSINSTQCKKCGAANATGARFCSNCGEALA